MYAVIDVETTGLRTSWHDRIVEVAVVHLDEHGHVTGEWCSLVNPDRDLGPQHIHGISAADARQAPSFAHLAGHLASLLRNHVVVAHNLPFDITFLRAEYDRIGQPVPLDPTLGLCTMRLASHLLPTAGCSLVDCRRTAGLPPHQTHSALHDAKAAGELLAHYLSITGQPPPWTATCTAGINLAWPTIPTTPVIPVQRRAPGHRPQHFLTRLVDRLPRLHQPQGDGYLDILDQALLDRHISATEADALVATAEEFGLARIDVLDLHHRYLANLAAIALEDSMLTAAERHDLDQVAALLGLQPSDVDKALATANDTPAGETRPGSWRLHPGDLVVFTGTMHPPREEWQAQAVATGLHIADTVTKKTRLLVAADPDSMSGKAKKARQYGIPIVHPSAYLRLLSALPASA